MAPTPLLRLSFVLCLLLGCSASRGELLESECLDDDQCATGARCESERCVPIEEEKEGTEDVRVSAVGRVEGAPGVSVEVTSKGGEGCELREETGVVCALQAGATLSLVAPAVEGYRFTGWSGSAGCEGDQPKLELPKLRDDVECVAHYVRRLRVSGLIADADGVAISASSEHEAARCEGASCEVDEDSEAVLTAPERDGYRLQGFEGAGCDAVEGYRVTVSPHGDDVTCTATYVESLTARGRAQGVDALVIAEAISDGPHCEGQLCALEPGQSVQLRAPEAAGFRFVGWTGEPACLGSEPTLALEDVTTNLVCTAEYLPRFTVEGVSEGADATITASSSNQFSRCEGAQCEVDVGEAVTLYAGTVPGFRLKGWLGEGCEPASGTSAIVRDVQADTRCVAEYIEGVSVSGDVVGATGEVVASSSDPGATCARGSCSVDVGSGVTLTAPALPGRTFRGWSGDPGCESTASTLELADVRESMTCSATFAPRFEVAGRVSPLLSGDVRASSSAANASCTGARCELDEGSSLTLEATASAGYRFVGWSGGGACSGADARLTLSDVRASVTCIANFVARIEVSGVVAPVDGGTIAISSPSSGARCDAASVTCTVDAGSDVVLNAAPRDGYRFARWSGCGSLLVTQTSGILTVRAALADQRCTANFERITYPVSVVVGLGAGEVSASTGGTLCAGARCNVPHGGSAELTARPAAGYRIGNWYGGAGCNGGASERATPTNVQAPVMCTVNFTEIPRYTIRGVTAGGGTVSCTDGCLVQEGGSQTLTAVADTAEGYRFAGWQGCTGRESGNQMIYSDVRSNQVCRANFQRYVTVSVTAQSLPLDASEFNFAPTTGCAENQCVVAVGARLTIRVPYSTGTVASWGCAGSESSDDVAQSLTLDGISQDIQCNISWLILF